MVTLMLRVVAGRREAVDGPGGIALVYATTGIYGSSSIGGAGFGYSRPVAVVRPDRIEVPIRDHVMLSRLALFLVLGIAALWRALDGG